MDEKRLLVLDDDAAVARTIAFVAGAHGFRVHTTSSPEDFFERVRTWAPNCLAIDLVMPSMDGVEILRSLAASGCPARIILMSGVGSRILESAGRAATERGLRIGGILPKPFTPRQLRAMLDAPDGDGGAGASADADVAARAGGAPDERYLDEALRLHQFVLHYQPKVRLATREVAGFEALVRWQHSRFGLIYPDRFVALAERSERIDTLTRDIVDMGLHWFAAFDVDRPLSISINVSARNLADVGVADILHAQCMKCGVDPQRVILELTETSAMQDAAVALDILTRLCLKGFKLSIDDFGTGYSSMTQLAKLPVSEIKIDRSFVASMRTSAEAAKIVASTIGLGKALGLTTVAEGVENAATSDMLETLGCELAQGFHYARPMAGPAAQHWLVERDGFAIEPWYG